MEVLLTAAWDTDMNFSKLKTEDSTHTGKFTRIGLAGKSNGIRQICGIVHYNFAGFFQTPKVIFTFLLEFVLSFLLTGRIMAVMENYNTPVQAIEPFLWTFGDGTAVLLSSLLLLLLFSDLPKLTPLTPYQLVRTTKRKWLFGQFVYVILVTVLYTVFMLLFTTVLCMKNSYPGNLWSETAAMLGYSELGKNLQVPSTVRVMESISPYGCMVQVFLLLFCYSLTLSFVILVGNLYKGKTKGMVLGLLYSIFGFLLDPNVLAALLHKEKYEMYQINVLICWISPLNQAVYGKHDLGYDLLLPKIWQSCIFFGVVLLVLAVLALRRMKRYPFEFLGEKA